MTQNASIETWIESISFSGGEQIQFEPGSITVIVGPNSSGKTTLLNDIKRWLSGGGYFWRSPDYPPEAPLFVLANAQVAKKGTFDELKQWLDANVFFGPADFEAKLVYQWMGAKCDFDGVAKSWKHERLGQLTHILCNLFGVEERLYISEPVEAIETFKDPPKHPLHTLCSNDEVEVKVSSLFQAAFGVHLVSKRAGGKFVSLHVIPPSESIESVDRASPAYLKHLTKFPSLNAVGHGMRSFAGCLMAAFTSPAFILLIDEPEVFLHPPHARLLGTLLAREKRSNQQLIVSTHSSDFLRGVLDSGNRHIKVIRLNREGDVNHAHELGSEKIRELWSDPILRFSNVLDGIFHDLAIVCEGDADCRFYQAVLDLVQSKNNHARDTFFTWTNGKDRVSTVVGALRAVGVPTRVIVDFDILENEQSLQRLVRSLGGVWEEFRDDWRYIHNQIELKFPKPTPEKIQRQISEILATEKGGIVSKAGEEKIRESLRSISPWKLAKQSGVSVMPNGDPTIKVKKFLKTLQSLGLFVVECGELERFVPSVGGHGPKWVSDVLTQKNISSDPELELARNFVSLVVDSPNIAVGPKLRKDTSISEEPVVTHNKAGVESKPGTTILQRLFRASS